MIQQRKSIVKQKYCNVCGKSFASAIRLQTHIKSTHNEDKTACHECGKYVKSSQLNAHMNNTHRDFKCHHCDYATKYITELGDHLMRKHEISVNYKKIEAKYFCSVCDFKTARKYNLEIHESRQHNIKMKCKDCDYEAGTRRAITDHRKYHHNLNTVFECNKCDFKASSVNKKNKDMTTTLTELLMPLNAAFVQIQRNISIKVH